MEVEVEVTTGEVAQGAMMVGVVQAVVRAVQMVVVHVAAEYTAVATVEARALVGSEQVAAEAMDTAAVVVVGVMAAAGIVVVAVSMEVWLEGALTVAEQLAARRVVAKARVRKARAAGEEKALVARVTEVWQEGPREEVLAV